MTGALDVTLFSYNGSLDFGLIACREMVPDVWNLIGHRNDALAELVKLSTRTGTVLRAWRPRARMPPRVCIAQVAPPPAASLPVHRRAAPGLGAGVAAPAIATVRDQVAQARPRTADECRAHGAPWRTRRLGRESLGVVRSVCFVDSRHCGRRGHAHWPRARIRPVRVATREVLSVEGLSLRSCSADRPRAPPRLGNTC